MDQTLTDIQARADQIRQAHEGEVQQRCDGIIKQYRAIAEQATAQAVAFRQEQQLRSMEGLKSTEEERMVFEKKVMDRANGLITTAQLEAKRSAEKLEREREKFARFEVEVRRQFEAHCRNFEGRIRAKAVAMLSGGSNYPDVTKEASAAFDAIRSREHTVVRVQGQAQAQGQANLSQAGPQSQPKPQAQPQLPPPETDAGSLREAATASPHKGSPRDIMSPSESKQDEKIRRTVSELKQYMASLSSGGSFLESPGPSSATLAQNDNSGIKSPPLRRPPPVPRPNDVKLSDSPYYIRGKPRALEQKKQQSPPHHQQQQQQQQRQRSPQYAHKRQGEVEMLRAARDVPIFGSSTTGPFAHQARFYNTTDCAPQKAASSLQPMSQFVETIVDRSAQEDTTRLMEGLNSLY